jgi:hypothetical protein
MAKSLLVAHLYRTRGSPARCRGREPGGEPAEAGKKEGVDLVGRKVFKEMSHRMFRVMLEGVFG